jgi:hypothetical protein
MYHTGILPSSDYFLTRAYISFIHTLEGEETDQMRIPVITMALLEQRLDPTKWYRWRDLKVLFSEFSEPTVTRFLRRVPYIVEVEEVPGNKIQCKRPVRVYSGQALIDNGYVGSN